MPGYVPAQRPPAQEKTAESSGVEQRTQTRAAGSALATADTRAAVGRSRPTPNELSLLQLRQALDQSPPVQSQAALQRALDRSAAAKAAPKRKEKPPLQRKGIMINDDVALEREADLQGQKALTATPTGAKTAVQLESVVQFVKPYKVVGQKGFFVGEPNAIHIHLVAANDHLKLSGSGKRINLVPKGNGYDPKSLNNALTTLQSDAKEGQPGYADCLEWLKDELAASSKVVKKGGTKVDSKDDKSDKSDSKKK